MPVACKFCPMLMPIEPTIPMAIPMAGPHSGKGLQTGAMSVAFTVAFMLVAASAADNAPALRLNESSRAHRVTDDVTDCWKRVTPHGANQSPALTGDSIPPSSKALTVPSEHSGVIPTMRVCTQVKTLLGVGLARLLPHTS